MNFSCLKFEGEKTTELCKSSCSGVWFYSKTSSFLSSFGFILAKPSLQNKVGQRTQKQDRTQQASFFACRKKTALVSSCTDPEAMHVPSQRFKTINFPNNRVEALMAICPEKPVPTALLFSSRSLPTKYIPVPWPRVWKLKSWAHGFFGTIVLMKFVLRNPCQQLCSFSLAQCQQNCARPIAQGLETLNNFDKSWGHSFPEQSY